MASPWVVAGAVVLLLLAGCAGAPAQSPTSTGRPSSVVQASPSLGEASGTSAILGTVVNEEELPVAQARVGISASEVLEATTDEGGRFEFRGLAAGTYTVFVERLGYESVARRVDLADGEESPVRFQLKAIEVRTSYNLTKIAKGYWQCDVPVALVVFNCADVHQFTGPRPDSAFFDVDRDWNSTFFELTWKGTGPTADTAPGVYCFQGGVTKDNKYISFPTSRTPQRPLRVTLVPAEGDQGPAYRHQANCYPVGTMSGTIPSNGVGVVIDQTWTVYATTFFVEGVPDGFTAIPPE